ncbi:MAG: hypothetical protein A3D65_06515 [Candidatus Lloydbacteria bacterium RIFCSPHIGHO2_02_FULL_50_13]|uniref:DUF192 domain-containing protein n=1 Tax=Candidatus Lloydbacteria bacterium RIFCSPHIGHO2_02_FULL_50_13 TaxID=1798661 RepID=A0A1G2D9V5_9BACT|nr:MAG: hypothetical protein A3D65_06515 [Candidatus Lloydbacteria bacterium RIFCSPHIGHO2_02_FULL_50_13]
MDAGLHHLGKRQLWDYAALVALVFLLGFVLLSHETADPVAEVSRGSVVINGTTVAVEIVETPEERTKGLSGRPALLDGEGMLFIFDRADRYGFWMPNMHFAIDIIWIGPEFGVPVSTNLDIGTPSVIWRIVDVSPNISPDSYPQMFTPTAPAQYVLEVPAGTALRRGWKVGDGVRF